MRHRYLLCFAVFLPLAFVLKAAPVLERAPNSTLRMPEAPPLLGYTTVNAFPGLTFGQPVSITTPPGETNRLFVCDKVGRILVITNLANPNVTPFLNISSRVNSSGESGLLGLAFHPGYATNRYFFVFYSLNTNTTQGTGLHQRVSRFQTSDTNASAALAATELPLITQYDTADNHNGGCLQFGAEGFLYISVGDGGAQYDGSANSQRIDKNFFSAIMRIDVDKQPGNLVPNPHPANTTNYFIPADNPYIGLTSFNGIAVNSNNIRTEFYAIGFRNPWRFSFDAPTGFLYCGDVGQDAYEEVDVVVKGGNYGWAYREGLHPGFKAGSPVNQVLLNPIQEYPHGSGLTSGNSVTGGIVYRGRRLSQLTGSYVFADYVSGNVWALRYDGTNTVPFRRLTVRTSIAAFGTDPANGDVLLASLPGTIYRLAYSSVVSGVALPATLADTGAFTNLSSLVPHPAIVPYDLNVPFWSDGARKTRWFSVPNTNLTIAFDPNNNWTFPTGTVWIKHFDLEMTNGIPESAVRLETRLLVKNSNGVYGATYRWGSSRTNATIVPEEGLDEPFLISDRGTTRTQFWHYPGRDECLTCHTPVGGGALGFNTAQLNRLMDYGGAFTNQLGALSEAGYFSAPLPSVFTLRALASATNEAVSLEYRVRSYLAANCVQCHQPGGPTVAAFDTRIITPLSETGLINARPNNNLGDPTNRIVVPGDPGHSLLLQRLATPGTRRMPPLATTELDVQSINLVSNWIRSDLASYQSFAQWQMAFFGSTNGPGAGKYEDYDQDGAANFQEYLVHSDPLLPQDAWRMSALRTNGMIELTFPQIANRGFEVQEAPALDRPIPWRPLEVLENRPWISSTNFQALIRDRSTNAARYYRVRIYEP